MKRLARLKRLVLYYAFKAVNLLLELLGRLLVFNTFLPEVGEIYRDLKYGNKKKQAVDVFVPPGGGGPFPVLVFIHGGGFMSMDKRSYDRISRCFAAEGFLVFNANYRLAPRAMFGEQARDTAAAIRFARENADRYGGDSSRVFLAGDSAGAFLVSWYAASLRNSEMLEGLDVGETIPAESVAGLLLYYGVYDLESVLSIRFSRPMRWIGESIFGEDPVEYRRMSRQVSPQRNIHDRFPPSLIVSGGMDPVRSQSVDLASLLAGMDAPHRTLFLPWWRYPGSLHGFLNFWFLRCARRAMDESVEFLRETAGTGRWNHKEPPCHHGRVQPCHKSTT